MSEGWAIAGCFHGAPHLYYARIQYDPEGSITFARIEDRDPFMKPMTFINEISARAVLNLMVLKKDLAQFFEWKVVFLEGY